MTKNNSFPGFTLLRSLPFLLTLVLVLMLFFCSGTCACAEPSSDEETALPEYTITLSDSEISSSCSSVLISGSTVTITEAGSYTVSGILSDGQIRIDTDKENKVRLILDGVSITNADSAAIYVVSADKLVIKLKDGTASTLTTSGSFAQTDESIDGVIFSKEDITISGTGSLVISAPGGHGIVSKDDLKIKEGSISVNAGRKTLSANDTLSIEGGTVTLNAGTEGMEATCVLIDGGVISIQAGDDGINATQISDSLSPAIEINGGDLSIVMGAGDTDGIDSNGSLTITGGSINVTGNSSFDIDGTVTFTGGTVIVNGQQVDSIPNQVMGGMMGGMMGGPGSAGVPGSAAAPGGAESFGGRFGGPQSGGNFGQR